MFIGPMFIVAKGLVFFGWRSDLVALVEVRAGVQPGAGTVVDSDPECEQRERIS
jgi:uncharacterized membrane protein YGL010W